VRRALIEVTCDGELDTGTKCGLILLLDATGFTFKDIWNLGWNSSASGEFCPTHRDQA